MQMYLLLMRNSIALKSNLCFCLTSQQPLRLVGLFYSFCIKELSMAIRERAQQVLRLSSKEARIEGMKLIADALINNDGSIKEVESGLGKNYFHFLVSELKQQLNTL